MSEQETLPSRRGAPPGNINALKHGFYSSRFKQSDLTALAKTDFTGLAEEIALLRLYIRRVVLLSSQIEDIHQLLETLRILSLASGSLSRLVRAHTVLLASAPDETRQAINDAFAEIALEIEHQDFSLWPSSHPPAPPHDKSENDHSDNQLADSKTPWSP